MTLLALPSLPLPTSVSGAIDAPVNLPVDLAGNAVNPLSEIPGRALVLFFVAVECPISNRYAPLMNALAETYHPEGVALWIVYPDPDSTADAIAEHCKAYALKMPALRDPGYFLVRRAEAVVTPQVAVFVPSAEPESPARRVYTGRIDDQYAAFGKWRSEPAHEDLKEILEAIASGADLEPRTTKAVGCYIPPRFSGP